MTQKETLWRQILARVGSITGVNGNMVTVRVDGRVRQHEVAHVHLGERRLKSEVVRIRGDIADLQLFENSRGLRVGGGVEFTGELLSVELGPGLLGSVFDGLQTPLKVMAGSFGHFLEGGVSIPSLSRDRKWQFSPLVKTGDSVEAGHRIGFVREGKFDHHIMVPFHRVGTFTVSDIVESGEYLIDDKVACIEGNDGEEHITLSFRWPVKRPVTAYEERLAAKENLLTRIRIIDTLFPVGRGGTYCIPGPFGAGKTVLQQITSRNAMVDVVIIAACGERAGEVVETIRHFPEIKDSFTGRYLMERTIIICNTSSMPVAARESSVYTAVTLAEYYRQMGLNVLLLADSTSRWAQAMRERSGRLEEIPGEEAFPAYLESVIADFYERAGTVRLKDGSTGSVTIGGTISPSGGFFEEPVTQATLKVVGAFHGLSRERSDARRYPAIEPLQSWSRYSGIISAEEREWILAFLRKADEIEQMMKVVGEEGTSLDDYVIYMKGELFDGVYLQQNAFHEIDSATPEERQVYLFNVVREVMETPFAVTRKDDAKNIFFSLRQLFLDLNFTVWDSPEFMSLEEKIITLINENKGESAAAPVPQIEEAFVETRANSKLWRGRRLKRLRQEEDGFRESDEEDLQQD
ncbi:MAG: V-type ATP synthase subunit A [Deltaproteobacteria bacterium]|nr:V-type ATP synthase subunit A [Deltaproteobacteria bacterium]